MRTISLLATDPQGRRLLLRGISRTPTMADAKAIGILVELEHGRIAETTECPGVDGDSSGLIAVSPE